jgi:hypothetical protein
MRALMITGLLAALSGCATTAEPTPPAKADTIRFAAGRCFGACPSYSVIIEPDGSGVLYPEKYTSVPGETRFTVTPAQYRRLRDTLAPFRPPVGTQRKIAPGEPSCKIAATDMSNYQIVWTRVPQKPTQLDFYGGCHDPQHKRLRAAIATVPKLLGIEKMLTPAPGTTGKTR